MKGKIKVEPFLWKEVLMSFFALAGEVVSVSISQARL